MEKFFPKIAQIEMRELHGNLAEGANTKNFRSVFLTPPIYSKKVMDGGSCNLLQPQTMGAKIFDRILELESFCLPENCVGVREIWSLVSGDGVEICQSSRVQTAISGRYLKYVQRWRYNLIEANRVNFVQFICTARKTKLNGCGYWTKGELLTLSLETNLPLISVNPRMPHTFVSVSPQQWLQVIADDSYEMKLMNESCLHYKGKEVLKGKDVFLLRGKLINAYYFKCFQHAEFQSTIFIDSTCDHESYRAITIPAVINEGRGRFGILLHPIGSFEIYGHNLDGFLLRFNRKINFEISPECPLELISSYVAEDRSEFMIVFKFSKIHYKKRIVVERESNETWNAKGII